LQLSGHSSLAALLSWLAPLVSDIDDGDNDVNDELHELPQVNWLVDDDDSELLQQANSASQTAITSPLHWPTSPS